MTHPRFAIAILVLAAAAPGCMDRRPAPVCPVPTELKSDAVQANAFDGVDMLFVVDDSGSMAEEQSILATSFYLLVNALANPLPTWGYDAVDSLRIAVTTSNMGLSSNGESNDQYWPGGDAPGNCHDLGDNGAFQAIDVASVDVQNDVIKCADGAAQCPPGWACVGVDPATGVGRCHTDGPTAVACPDLGAPWAESSAGAPNPSLITQAACLAQRGTDGCGFEQQLSSAATALARGDHAAFLAPSHLLAVLVVTDEEDCSMEDGKSLFETDEVALASPNKVNVACGEHPEYLFDPEHFYDAFVAAKGTPGAVIFAAIAGVPYGDQPGADECQGLGSTLGGCLAQGAMQLAQVQHEDGGWYYDYACERGELTKAYPGRRYVELANEHFGDMGYVFSICNEDWSPAMEEVANLIGAKITATCYDKALDWDPVEEVAKCNVVVEFENPEVEECPEGFAADPPIIERGTSSDGEELTRMLCAVPKLPSARDCAAQTPEQAAAIGDGFGWFYCESLDAEAADAGAEAGCRYTVQLTEAAKRAVLGRQVAVQCLQQLSFEDRNCQEDTRAACADDADDDGNGVWDCAAEDADAPTLAPGEKGHLADPSCCPMAVAADGRCDLAPPGVAATWDEICPAGVTPYVDGYPDACREAAARLGCDLP
jgi:hypothetical protein